MTLTSSVFLSIAILVGPAFPQASENPRMVRFANGLNSLPNTSTPRKYRSHSDRLSKEERKSLEPVEEAFSQLTLNFRAALPLLIEHLKDSRFSYPQEHPTSGVFENQTVGDACHAIIQGKVLLTGLSFVDSRDIGVWVEVPFDREWYQQSF